MRLMDHTPDDFTGPVNLGNPGEFTIRQLAETDHQAGRRQVEARHIRPLPADDPKQRRPDITLARDEARLGAQGRPRDGLQKTIEYFDTLLKSNKGVRGIGR